MSTIEATQLTVGAVLGRGGQALVVSAATESGDTFAFKRYHDRHGRGVQDAHQKIASMMMHPPDDPTASFGHTSIAWPRHLVMDKGDFVGFLMDTLGEPHLTIPDVRDEAGRRNANVSFGWGELVTCARNLCSAVAALHEVGAAWGDLNEGNVAIYPDGLVTLLDIDACAWRNEDESFDSAGVGVEEFMPPERFVSGGTVTPEGDCWGLAVAVHLILMEGFHPFLFVPPDLDGSPSMEERMVAGMTPLLNSELVPPPMAPQLDVLPDIARQALRRTFGAGRSTPVERTTAAEWVGVLDLIQANLVTCELGHDYSNHLDACPWCELQERRQARRTGNQVRLAPSQHSTPGPVEDLGDTTTHVTEQGSAPGNGNGSGTTETRRSAPWRWWSLALVVSNVALVGSIAMGTDLFELRMFAFPLLAIAFLTVFHAEADRVPRPGLVHLVSFLGAGALAADLVPENWVAGDRIAIAAILPVVGHLFALARAGLAPPER